MCRKKIVLLVFLSLTIINLLVFFFRDYFQYRSYSSYLTLYGSCNTSCINKWKKFVADYPEQEFIQTQTITDSILPGNLPSYEKAKLLGTFIYNQFYDQPGRPLGGLNSCSPLSQYHILSSADSQKLWCGNFAQIFSWFCWSQGIPCRIIEIMKAGDHHILNECYIAETGKWVLVDLTFNIVGIKNKNGHLLNFQDARNALKKKEQLTLYRNTGADLIDSNDNFNYYLNEYPAYYYYRINNEKIYSPGDKLKRYFLPVSWYEVYNETPGMNIVFYLKPVLFVLWIISFFVFLICRTKFKS